MSGGRDGFPLIFERSRAGRRGCDIPATDVPREDPAGWLPAAYLRARPPALPEVKT